MKARLLILALFLTILTSFSLFNPNNALAQVKGELNPSTVTENTPTVTVTFSNLVPNTKYMVCLHNDSGGSCKNKTEDESEYVERFTSSGAGTHTVTVCGKGGSALKTSCDMDDFFSDGTYEIDIFTTNGSTALDNLTNGSIKIHVQKIIPEITLTPETAKKNDPLTIKITGLRHPNDNDERNTYDFDLDGKAVDGTDIDPGDPPGDLTVDSWTGWGERTFTLSQNGVYTLKVYRNEDDHKSSNIMRTFTITITDDGIEVVDEGAGAGAGAGAGQPGENPCGMDGSVCKTALGDIPTNPTAFAGKVLTVGIGLAGGIALIIMVVGSIKILTSAGDPKKVGEGREMIVAAVAGLLFLILAILILRFIGATFLPTNPFP